MRPELQQAVDIVQRDPAALAQALELLQNTVFSFSMKLCGHREDAEDTMQDVLLKSVRYLPGFDNAQALAVWLYKVARNRCLMSRRRSKFAPTEELSLDELMPTAQELESLTASDNRNPEDELLRNEDAERLQTAILQVPAQYRTVLVLHDMEELSSQDVARITGLSEGNVRVRLHRARLAVRKALAGDLPKTAVSAHAGQKPRRAPSCKKMFAALSDYIDGELDDATCATIDRHMDGCENCKAFIADLRRTVEKLSRLPGQPVDPVVARRVREQVTKLKQALAAQTSK